MEKSFFETADENRQTLFVDVLLPLYLPLLYTYRVPLEMNEKVAIGKRVWVQFGKKKVYAALIRHIHSNPPPKYEAKYIGAVLDEFPVVSEIQLQFWEWIANYYMCTQGEVMKASMPAGLKLESETRIFLTGETPFAYEDLDDKEYLLVEALELHKEISIDDASEILRTKSTLPIVKSLYDKGIVSIREDLQNSYKPKTVICIRLADEYLKEENLRPLFDKLESKAPKQLQVLISLLSDFKGIDNIEKSKLLEKSKSTDAAITSLIEKGVLEKYLIEIDRISYKNEHVSEYQLTPEQHHAVSLVKQKFENRQVVLLHGITSSGKTLVYTDLIAEQIKQGNQVLYLLPEVALTSQIISRLRAFFGNELCVWHYKFSDFERVEIWNKIRSGSFKLILGTRSSILLPFHQLGLIIVDEEHDGSYKQTEPAPRYHARDAAIYLANLHNAKTLLGTATPSIETIFNARRGKFGLVELGKRFGNVELPEIVLADVAEAKRTKTMHLNYTEILLNSIRSAVLKKQQVILFQNRRGYVPVTECSNCAWSPSCINCDITLTYYKTQHILKCHYCGYKIKPVNTCAACGNNVMQTRGFGTEKIEDDLKALIPGIRISRLDYDTTRTKEGHQIVITQFKEHKIDVLVGTQMVSKGLDFEKVSLVGVMDADQILHFPDFRAMERAFQMITQVAGRAGRGKKRGLVIVQTRKPQHDLFKLIIENNYEGLVDYELQERQKFFFPPFARLLRITIKHKDEKIVNEAAAWLANELRSKLEISKVLGPEFHYIPRIQNLYIKNILIKLEPNQNALLTNKMKIAESIQKVTENKDFQRVRIYADMDCY